MSAKIIPLRPDVLLPQPSAPLPRDPRIDAAIGGDTKAAHGLIVEILPRVRNLIRYLVRSDDVDDLTQEALLKVLERLSSYRGEGRFEAWVDGVTMRVTLRGLSKLRAEVRRQQPQHDDELENRASANAPSPRYVARRRAVEALDKLPDAQRHALVMHHVLGMTVGEISDELAVPGETVRSRLRVGMGQLRALLGALKEQDT
jgi:RNA polymerase sigma-70 factor (ECF subfamily)